MAPNILLPAVLSLETVHAELLNLDARTQNVRERALHAATPSLWSDDSQDEEVRTRSSLTVTMTGQNGGTWQANVREYSFTGSSIAFDACGTAVTNTNLHLD